MIFLPDWFLSNNIFHIFHFNILVWSLIHLSSCHKHWEISFYTKDTGADVGEG